MSNKKDGPLKHKKEEEKADKNKGKKKEKEKSPKSSPPIAIKIAIPKIELPETEIPKIELPKPRDSPLSSPVKMASKEKSPSKKDKIKENITSKKERVNGESPSKEAKKQDSVTSKTERNASKSELTTAAGLANSPAVEQKAEINQAVASPKKGPAKMTGMCYRCKGRGHKSSECPATDEEVNKRWTAEGLTYTPPSSPEKVAKAKPKTQHA